METLLVDGFPERLLIRGNDPEHNPVLLFVHGGPGFPGAAVRQVNSELERDFTVVHWDQRGTGASYSSHIPRETMTIEQFVRETLIVARAVRREFHQRKIYLVGHSWGTLPAALAAVREPELFQAYVAMSQLVDIDESERRLTKDALNSTYGPDAARRADELRKLGPPPYLPMPVQDRAAGLIAASFPRVTHQATTLRLTLLAFTSRYYSLPALYRLDVGYLTSRRIVDPQLHGYDLRRLAPKIDTPVYFFVGRQDVTFGVSLQEEYFHRLIAPKGKHIVYFDDSTHWPHLERPARFLEEMRRVRAQTWPVRR